MDWSRDFFFTLNALAAMQSLWICTRVSSSYVTWWHLHAYSGCHFLTWKVIPLTFLFSSASLSLIAGTTGMLEDMLYFITETFNVTLTSVSTKIYILTDWNSNNTVKSSCLTLPQLNGANQSWGHNNYYLL